MAQNQIETLSVTVARNPEQRTAAQTLRVTTSIGLSNLTPEGRHPSPSTRRIPLAQGPSQSSAPLATLTRDSPSSPQAPPQAVLAPESKYLPFSTAWHNFAALIASGVAFTTIFYMARSYDLARWTAKKDYIQTCGVLENGVFEINSTCPLEKPPYLRKRWMELIELLSESKDVEPDPDITWGPGGSKLLISIVYSTSIFCLSFLVQRYRHLPETALAKIVIVSSALLLVVAVINPPHITFLTWWMMFGWYRLITTSKLEREPRRNKTLANILIGGALLLMVSRLRLKDINIWLVLCLIIMAMSIEHVVQGVRAIVLYSRSGGDVNWRNFFIYLWTYLSFE